MIQFLYKECHDLLCQKLFGDQQIFHKQNFHCLDAHLFCQLNGLKHGCSIFLSKPKLQIVNDIVHF